MGVEAPTGTVTFFFTDIEGSTSLWEAAPAAMRAAMERHDSIIRAAIDRHDGHLFSTGADGFAAAFARTGEAAAAAVEAQQGLTAEPWPQCTPLTSGCSAVSPLPRRAIPSTQFRTSSTRA